MPKIELLLGVPTTTEREDEIEELISELNINMESAVILRVKALIKWLSGENKEDQNYLDLVATDDINQAVRLPRISYGVYKHRGYVLPKMIINGFHLIAIETGEAYLISNRLVDVIGHYLEDTFEFEYWGFKRVGKVVPNKSDVIYHLGDKPYIYHSGQFIAIEQRGLRA
jgi:hypothetical protein